MSSGIYVCYNDYGYDGSSEPETVFRKEIDAKKWCKVNDNGQYKFLEIKSKFTVEVSGQ